MDDRRRYGETNSTLRTKEQGWHITLNEHDDDDDDDDDVKLLAVFSVEILRFCRLGIYNISKINFWINYVNLFPFLYVRTNVHSETDD